MTSLERMLTHGEDHGLGNALRASGRLLNDMGFAQLDGAQNLLLKALRAMSAGDEEKADRLIRRAAGMEYNPREEDFPGVRGAQVILHGQVNDVYEVCAEDEREWLDAALQVLEGASGAGREELGSIVHGFVLEGAELTEDEADDIRRAAGWAPLNADLVTADASVEERVTAIRSVLEAARAYLAALLAMDPAGDAGSE